LGRLRKDTVVTYFKALSLNMPGGTSEDHEIFVMIVGLGVTNRTLNLPNKNPEILTILKLRFVIYSVLINDVTVLLIV
jgi:hypothetical protein